MMARDLINADDNGDIIPCDWVTGPFKGKGLVEEVNGDPPQAIVAVGGCRHIIATKHLRRVKPTAGWSLDFRR